LPDFVKLSLSKGKKANLQTNTMKLLLEIEDEKADFILELLKNFKFVKAKTISPYKAEVLSNLKQSIEEYNQVKEGKTKLISAKELLDEL
jgi:hypothetical protein